MTVMFMCFLQFDVDKSHPFEILRIELGPSLFGYCDWCSAGKAFNSNGKHYKGWDSRGIVFGAAGGASCQHPSFKDQRFQLTNENETHRTMLVWKLFFFLQKALTYRTLKPPDRPSHQLQSACLYAGDQSAESCQMVGRGTKQQWRLLRRFHSNSHIRTGEQRMALEAFYLLAMGLRKGLIDRWFMRGLTKYFFKEAYPFTNIFQ